MNYNLQSTREEIIPAHQHKIVPLSIVQGFWKEIITTMHQLKYSWPGCIYIFIINLESATLVCPAGVPLNEGQTETVPHQWMKERKGKFVFDSPDELLWLLTLISGKHAKFPPRFLIRSIRDYKERDAIYTEPG